MSCDIRERLIAGNRTYMESGDQERVQIKQVKKRVSDSEVL